MKMPSITVVTPCLNAARTLPDTLESVRAQGYPNLEHLVIDGGSTDGTLEILEAAEGVRYVSEPDSGLSDAFNKGVRLAQGEIIGWLNADDVYDPGALLAVGEAFARDPEANWGFGRCKIVGADGRVIRRVVTAYKNVLLRRYSFPLHLTNNFISSPATFARRSALVEIGVLDERFRYSADYDLWLRLGRRGRPVFVDHDVARFRMAEGSLSMSGFERQFEEHAVNARENGSGHPLAVGLNGLLSAGIVIVYRLLRARRRLIARGSGAS